MTDWSLEQVFFLPYLLSHCHDVIELHLVGVSCLLFQPDPLIIHYTKSNLYSNLYISLRKWISKS